MVYHVEIYVDFLSMIISLGLETFTFYCEMNLDHLCLRPMKVFRIQWSRAFNLMCEVALNETIKCQQLSVKVVALARRCSLFGMLVIRHEIYSRWTIYIVRISLSGNVKRSFADP